MATVATTLGRVGKKRRIIRRKPRTPREQFAARLRELAGDMPLQQLADILGVSVATASNYRTGERMPDVDDLPKIAAAFKLKHWLDLFR